MTTIATSVLFEDIEEMKIVIIHGTYGHPEENRFPWLKKELEDRGHEVYVPKLPTPENQTPSSRCDELQLQVPFVFDSDTVLVGHSLGAVYLLHILDRERKEPVKQAIFVSGFLHELGNEAFDTLNATFIDKEFNWERITNNISDVVIFHGDNDPYVPVSEAIYLHKYLGGDLRIINGGGHLNSSAGYVKFPEMLECILE